MFLAFFYLSIYNYTAIIKRFPKTDLFGKVKLFDRFVAIRDDISGERV